MLNSFPVALAVGVLLGFLSGLGVGGGSLLVVWLITVLGTEPRQAQGINLLFFLPAAAWACVFHIRNRKLPWSLVLPAARAGCLTAALAALLAGHMDTALLRKLFGGLLMVTGLWELCRKERK